MSLANGGGMKNTYHSKKLPFDKPFYGNIKNKELQESMQKNNSDNNGQSFGSQHSNGNDHSDNATLRNVNSTSGTGHNSNATNNNRSGVQANANNAQFAPNQAAMQMQMMMALQNQINQS